MTKTAKGKDKKHAATPSASTSTAAAPAGGDASSAGSAGVNKFQVDDKVFAMDGGDLYEAKV